MRLKLDHARDDPLWFSTSKFHLARGGCNEEDCDLREIGKNENARVVREIPTLTHRG